VAAGGQHREERDRSLAAGGDITDSGWVELAAASINGCRKPRTSGSIDRVTAAHPKRADGEKRTWAQAQ